MPSYNKVLLMGHITRDPEIRVTPNGASIANLGLASNRKWKDKAGQIQEEVTFVDVTAFGSQADALQKYCAKGDPLFIEGRLKLDQWEDKNTGEKRSKLGVVLERMEFLRGRSDSGQGGSSAPRPSAPVASPSSAGPVDDFDPNDDIPF